MPLRRRIGVLLAVGGLLLGCPRGVTEPPDEIDSSDTGEDDEGREREPVDDDDPRLDAGRCTGDSLDIEELIKSGVCTIPLDRAGSLPSAEQLVIEVPPRLAVKPGKPLEFDLVLRNVGREPIDLDLVFRQLLPLAPETTTWIGKGAPAGASPDPSCTLRVLPTEPPPERITLPPGAELPVPCEWHANTRLVDPHSYVGSECPDFQNLAAGGWRSVFRIGGRSVEVDIVVQ